MTLEVKQHVQGTSRKDEEKHLKETLDVIHANVDSYGTQVSELRTEIDVMLDHFHDDNPELINMLENTMTLHDHMARVLTRNERALNKPYFGRIVFYDEGEGKQESLYIGRGGIAIDKTTQAVIDWRAPIANAYYENGLGKCTYIAPDGKELAIDLQLKRTYEIEQGKLLDYFDSAVISNDELLTKYLARTKEAVLGEIVATIQQEQNEIIRRSPYHNIIVQGVAGSGKTTVAMHRISFILYNYEERFRPEDFYIVGSNRILLNYITGVLPDLDVHGVKQMTMEELFVRLLYEDWDAKKYAIRLKSQTSDKGMMKGTESWFLDLEAFCSKLEHEMICSGPVYLNPKQFVEGLENGRTGVYDRSTGKESVKELVRLIDGAAVERYITQNPNISIQSKINMLNERLIIKIKDEFLGKGVKYTEAERKAILKAYRNFYGPKDWKLSTFRIYEDFLKEQFIKYPDLEEVMLPGTASDGSDNKRQFFDVYDLAALAYIYKRTKETEVIREASHVVIDEAQDFGMMVYRSLHYCMTGCTYTVMGDVSQNIHFGYGLNDWEGLKKLLLDPDEMSTFGLLKKSYRNTVEISDFATNILHHGRFVHYPVEPIIRHGSSPVVRETSKHQIWLDAAEICRVWQKDGLPTIAVVCRNQEEADIAAKELSKHIEILESDLEKAEFGNGIMVLPVEYTKGLEFDAVLILDPSRETYPTDDGHAKLLYVAATRALHELCVLHTGNLTGLIADPIPVGAGRIMTGEVNENIKLTQHSKISNSPTKNQSETKIQKEDATNSTKGKEKQQTNTNRKRISIAIAKHELEESSERKSKGAMSLRTDYSGKKVEVPLTSRTTPVAQTNQVIPTERNETTGVVHSSTLALDIRKTNSPMFGDMPPNEKLRPLGHTKIDLAVKWVSKQADGLYLQSRYGILRLSPISSGIIRVTFAKGSKIFDGKHPLIDVDRVERFWTYRENSSTVELSTDELVLRVDKPTGAVFFMNREKQPLLSERSKECRQIENFSDGKQQTWTFFESNKKEHLFAVNMDRNQVQPIKGTALYISDGTNLPLLFSDKGYGIVVASTNPVINCDIPAYGSYIHTEKEEQSDYYFILGKSADTITNAYRYLTGTL